MTSDFWDAVRIVNFVILLIAFMVMLHKGILKMILDGRESFDWDRFCNFCWTLLACYSIGEVLYQIVGGGPRVLLQTAMALLQLWVVVFRYTPKSTPKDWP